MQNTVASETALFETAVFETAVFDTAALESVVFRPVAAPAVQTVSRTAAPWGKTLARTLLLKWDMIAIVALMLACSVYGIYALFFLTGF